MTTRQFRPNLDRQISREVTTTTTEDVTVTLPPTVFTWDTNTGQMTPADGEWYYQDETRLIVGGMASTGGEIMAGLENVEGVVVSFGGRPGATLTLVSSVAQRHPFTFQPTGAIILTFSAPIPVPVSGDSLSVSIPGATSTTTETTTTTETIRIWAQRRDFSGRDFTQVQNASLITLRDTRYIVRVESGPWEPTDTFLDENGERLTVQGVSQIQRSYLELLVRTL